MPTHASSTTPNIGLSQWLATDPVCREDFNADNALIDAALAGSLRLELGSYVGTGVSGSSHKSSLTFDERPLFVIISGPRYMGIAPGYQESFNTNLMSDNSASSCDFSWDENTLTYYSSGGDQYQFNIIRFDYCYLAVFGSFTEI